MERLLSLNSNAFSNKPLRRLDVSPPTLHERCELSALHDPMIATPANTKPQPPLALPISSINIPNPFRSPDSDNGNPATGNEDRRGKVARTDCADV